MDLQDKPMDIENRFDGPILVIGFRGFPINRFCYDVIYKGEIKSRLNFSQSDNMHNAYDLGFKDFRKSITEYGRGESLEKYTGTLQEYANRKYFKSPIKRKLYDFYLWIGKKLF